MAANFVEHYSRILASGRAERVTLGTALSESVRWSTEQFPGERRSATMEHLRREVEELAAADPLALEEYADVLMLLARAAADAGFSMGDLSAGVLAKLAVNRDRQWGEPDAHGVVEHVRDHPAPPPPPRRDRGNRSG